MIGFNIRTNAAKGTISTILGIIVILGSVVSVFAVGSSWTEATIGIGVGIAMVGLVKK